MYEMFINLNYLKGVDFEITALFIVIISYLPNTTTTSYQQQLLIYKYIYIYIYIKMLHQQLIMKKK